LFVSSFFFSCFVFLLLPSFSRKLSEQPAMRSLTLSFLLLGVAATAFAYAPPSPCGPCGTAAPCDAYTVAALGLYGTTTSDSGCGVWYKTGACSSLGLEDMVPFVGCVTAGSPGKRDDEQKNCMPSSIVNGYNVEAVGGHWCQDENGLPMCKVQQSAEVTVAASSWQSKKRDEEAAISSKMLAQPSKAGFFAHHNCRDGMGNDSCVFQGAGCQATDYQFALRVCETTLGSGFEPRSAAFDGQNIRVFCLKEQEAVGCCGPNPLPYGREFASNVLALNSKETSSLAIVASDAVTDANAYYGKPSPFDDPYWCKKEKCELDTMPTQSVKGPALGGATFVRSDASGMGLSELALQTLTPSGCSLKDADGSAEKWAPCFRKMRSQVEQSVGKLSYPITGPQTMALDDYFKKVLGPSTPAFDPATSVHFSMDLFKVQKAEAISYRGGKYQEEQYQYNSSYSKW
jgi:hypothetical protein